MKALHVPCPGVVSRWRGVAQRHPVPFLLLSVYLFRGCNLFSGTNLNAFIDFGRIYHSNLVNISTTDFRRNRT